MYHEVRSGNQKLNHVITNCDLVFVTNLNLPNSLKKEIEEFKMDTLTLRMNSSAFEQTKTSNVNLFEKCSFLNPLYDLCKEKFSELDPNSQIKNLIRLLLAKFPVGVTPADGVHRDSDELTYWTFLIQLKGNSGDTVFYKSTIDNTVVKSIPFVEGNLIIFPSIYSHMGLNTSTVDRYVVNYIAEIDTSFNKFIMKNSSSAIFK